MSNDMHGRQSRGSTALAVVVAYNRADLLARVLASLQSQSAGRVDVLVVDNASSDDTAAVAAASGAMVFNPGENLGGAGGFAWGVEIAIALGYDYAYLMDDDAIPEPDAVATILRAAREDPTKAFFASVPIDESGRHDGVAGAPTPSSSFKQQLPAALQGNVAVSSAAFLGLLLNLSVARRAALPYTEFFIWCDDVEYTSRLASEHGAICCTDSRIVHLSPEMQSLAHGGSLGWKYFYQVRNQLWLYRWGLRPIGRIARTQALATSLRAIRSEFRSQGLSFSLLRTTARAVTEGVLRRPAPRRPGSLLAENEHARGWLDQQRSRVDHDLVAQP
ncbi:glycosyltransferase [Amnibacterium setariae]|nr:glycosyltransferase [Amnibacterium setariae]